MRKTIMGGKAIGKSTLPWSRIKKTLSNLVKLTYDSYISKPIKQIISLSSHSKKTLGLKLFKDMTVRLSDDSKIPGGVHGLVI